MLEELNRTNLLYDIYAPLLTERQRQVIQLYFSDNYSLAEIASDYDISRQAVYDLIRRVLSSLEKLEQKLGLYQLFKDQQQMLDEAEQLLLPDRIEQADIQRLREIIAALRSSSEQ